MMAKTPDDRPASMTEVIALLQAAKLSTGGLGLGRASKNQSSAGGQSRRRLNAARPGRVTSIRPSSPVGSPTKTCWPGKLNSETW